MKKIILVLLFMISINSLFGQVNDSLVKSTSSNKKNYFGVEMLGSPLRLTYGRYIKSIKNFKQSFYFGISPLILIGWPSATIGYRIETPVKKKFNFHSEIGIETGTIMFPIFTASNKKVSINGTIVDASAYINLGVSYNLNRFIYTPLFIRYTQNSELFFAESENFSIHKFFVIGMNIKYKF